MNSNSIGNDGNFNADLRLFMTLPPKVRELVTAAPVNISSADIVSIKRRHGLDDDELYDEIDRIIRDIIRRLAEKDYGLDHPQASREWKRPIELHPRYLRKI